MATGGKGGGDLISTAKTKDGRKLELFLFTIIPLDDSNDFILILFPCSQQQ